jgi:2,3-bisphosphoglycerate-independent phosphoglycerate mutase
MSVPKPVVLCILDGWGIGPRAQGNAPLLANIPNVERIMATCPTATLITHGRDVGLPTGQMGNSEVGHTNIGAGRVVAMDLGQIDLAIEDGSFATNAALLSFAATVKAAKGRAHLMGVLSDGGVHGHLEHLIYAAKALSDQGLEVVLHVMTDGRDVAPGSASGYLATLLGRLPPRAQIATVSGRFYAMDRDNRWERVQLAYDAVSRGLGIAATNAPSAVSDAASAGESDEFVKPRVISGYSGFTKGDGLFFLNFRADRAREILSAFGAPNFTGFTRDKPDLSALLGIVDYSEAHNAFMTTMYPKQKIVNTIGEWVAKKGLRQFRLAETEKYPHVTFFLNGGKETPEPGEDRHMPKSPKVATYDLQPEMSAPEVGDHLVKAIEERYDLIVVNFANPDMVGHTGVLSAAIRACEAVDHELGRALVALEQVGGAMIVTADHGNCEVMVDPVTKKPHTAHTTNPVPVALIGGPKGARLSSGRLADLAPTLLDLMGLDLPPEMTGTSLIQR